MIADFTLLRGLEYPSLKERIISLLLRVTFSNHNVRNGPVASLKNVTEGEGILGNVAS
jgi:hypothetical protein